jgi:hypothetical protein
MNMKKLVLAAFAFLTMTATSGSVLAQKPTRITFKRGATAVLVTGRLNGYKSQKTYVIGVRKGQRLTTRNAGDNYITVGVEAPPGSTYEQDMAADCHDRNEVAPTVAGNYRITVTECMKADRWKGSFKLRVTVR